MVTKMIHDTPGPNNIHSLTKHYTKNNVCPQVECIPMNITLEHGKLQDSPDTH